MATECPVCHAPAAAGSDFCTACGWPLAPFGAGPLGPSEMLLGEIPAAYSVGPLCGPVRIEFTDRRMIVRWMGTTSFMIHPKMWKGWMNALEPGPGARLVRAAWADRPEPVAWVIGYPSFGAARAFKRVGIGIDPGFCMLSVTAWWDGISHSPMGDSPVLPPRRGQPAHAQWTVPGDEGALDAFLRQLPFAPVVGRLWVSPFHKLSGTTPS